AGQETLCEHPRWEMVRCRPQLTCCFCWRLRLVPRKKTRCRFLRSAPAENGGPYSKPLTHRLHQTGSSVLAEVRLVTSHIPHESLQNGFAADRAASIRSY